MYRRIILIIFVFSTVSCLKAQPNAYDISLIGRNELKGNNIKCSYQDQDGFLWFGTDKGLFRYDGVSFRSFHQDSGKVLSITKLIEFQSHLFLLTKRNKLFKVNLKNYLFSKVNPLKEKQTSDFKINDILVSQQEQLYISTTNGLFKKSDLQSSFLPVHLVNANNSKRLSNIDKLSEDEHGDLYFSDNQFKAIFKTNQLLAVDSLKNETVRCDSIFHFRNSVFLTYHKLKRFLWLTHDGKYMVIDAQTNKLILSCIYKASSRIVLDKEANVWLNPNRNTGVVVSLYMDSLDHNLFVRRDSQEGIRSQTNLYELVKYLSDYAVSSLFFDKNNTLWVGTEKNGLIKVESKNSFYRHYGLNEVSFQKK